MNAPKVSESNAGYEIQAVAHDLNGECYVIAYDDKKRFQPFVCWRWTEHGGFSSGHYTDDFETAKASFIQRIASSF